MLKYKFEQKTNNSLNMNTKEIGVGECWYRNGKSVPYLRLKGLWLENSGFTKGSKVKIDVTEGKIVVSVIE